MIAIDDYPYAGTVFCKDLDISLPLGAAYGDIGKESQTHFLILNYIFFVFFDILTQNTCFWCDDT